MGDPATVPKTENLPQVLASPPPITEVAETEVPTNEGGPVESDGNNNDQKRKQSKVLLPPAPPDLSLLEGLSHFILKLNLEPLDIGVPYSDEALKYDVFDQDGVRILILCETSKSCRICFWKTDRSFEFYVMNPGGKLIMKIKRPCSCCCILGVGCGDLCCNGIVLTMEDGTHIGSVSQKFRFCMPVYVIKNAIGEPTLRLKDGKCGFCCPCRIGCEAEFSILVEKRPPKTNIFQFRSRLKIGEIKQGWIEFSKIPIFSEGDNFGAKFPPNIDTRLKASILGALILINFLHFDKDPCAPTQYCC